MEDVHSDKPQNTLPFDNLYLNTALVNGSNKGWMYLFTILLLVLGYLSFQLILLYPLLNILKQNGITEIEIAENPSLLFDYVALKIDRNILFALELGMFVFACIGFFIGLKYIHHKTFTSVLTGFQKFRAKRFWFAFTIWSSLLILTFVIEYAINPEDFELTFNFFGLLISIGIMLVLMPLQTGIEEIIFRGYLIQGLALFFRNGIIPLFLTSLLFGLAHMSNPEVKKYGWEIMFTYYFIFALFMGAVSLLDEGLELALGIHFANNMISSILVSTPHSVVKTYSLFETQSENVISEILLWLVMASICFMVFKFKYRWTNFKLIVK